MENPWEDHLLERKVESDLKDLLKTLVAFANSVMPGHVATLLIGERDNGTVAGVTNPDGIQNRIRTEADKIYPPIVWRSTVYDRDGRACVRVEIEHSGVPPHFGGGAWVRRGSSTVLASEEVFQLLVETRLSVVRELTRWLEKDITVSPDHASLPEPRSSGFGAGRRFFVPRWDVAETATLVSVNRFWVTLRASTGERRSEPLQKLVLTWDDKKDRLKLIISY